MATKHVYEYPSSPHNDDTENNAEKLEETQEAQEEDGEEQEEDESEATETVEKPVENNVLSVLQRIPSSLILRKPKQEFQCFTCSTDFPDSEQLYSHIIRHVSLPSVVLDKLPSDDEDTPPSGDENWSDEDEVPNTAPAAKTPQKIDISQLLKKPGLCVKKPVEPDTNANSALNKLSGLGFTIKKNTTPIKKEPEEKSNPPSHDLMQKLGKLGGIKLKLKSDGNNTNSFKVVNGLKDFNASDDEDGGNNDSKEEQDEDEDQGSKSDDQEGSGAENESDEQEQQTTPASRKNSESEEEKAVKSAVNRKLANSLKNLKGKALQKIETPKGRPPVQEVNQSSKQQVPPTRKPGRPPIKQTPKRGANVPREIPKIEQPDPPQEKPAPGRSPSEADIRSANRPERPDSNRSDASAETVIVKKEVESTETQSSNMPLFSGQIKSERASPPLEGVALSAPTLTRVKTEPGLSANSTPVKSSPYQNNHQPVISSATTPLLPVTKTEDTGVTIIEINGDSNDEDDDCCVVSATPAPDIKPKTEYIAPKIENTPVSYPPPSYPTTPSSYSSSSSIPTYSSSTSSASNHLMGRLTGSTEKQHSFNWNAPDSKPPLDMLEKSADDIFESLLSGTKKESNLSDASEYISLDTLGPKHSCEVCNTRFTDMSLLDEHRRMTGHTQSIVPVSSSTLLPYNPASNLLSSLLPVKQIADQVGKLSTIGGTGPGFTHQQNVMINIQAYPGAGGVMMPPQYNSSTPYSGQTMPSDYPQSQNMYGAAPGQMPGQYSSQNYMGQQAYGQQQYQPSMTKPVYPGAPPSQYPPSSSPYSTASPLQSMQQAVYGQAPNSMGQMGPPSAPFAPASSPGGMKPPSSSGIKIQNVQTFPPVMGGQTMPGQAAPGGPMMPGQNGPEMTSQSTMSGQMIGGQLTAPNQIRMAPGANITGTRPRMATPRGPRPTIRPGMQVHGQVRGGQKPGMRMPMKRPGQMAGGPGQKRRPDMLLPGKHDNEDCQVMAMQKQREGLPMIQSVQGAKDKLNLGSQISITKKPVNREANAMANVLASRGISVKQKQKSRSPTPERPVPHIPNLGAGVSIKHTSRSSNFSIPEAKVGGGGMLACRICKKMFMNQNSLSVHIANAHPQSKVPVFKCDECPASYPKSLQLQHHKRVFHNVSGPNRELGLPVVDLSQEDNLKRLSSLGIYSFIPLANRERADGCFGIPVISLHNGLTNSLQALGADGLLSLGPLKPLPNS